jgi:hypothetical protein
MKMNSRMCILMALSFAATCSLEAAEWYLGGAPHYYMVDNDYAAIDGESGAGFHLIIGWRWQRIALEATMGGATIDAEEISSPFYPADSVDYAIFDLTAKYLFRMEANDRLIPWIGAGAGIHLVEWSSYVYSLNGSGYSVSAGLDVRLFYSCYLTGGFKYHIVDGTTDDQGTFSGKTMAGSLGLIWVFGESVNRYRPARR